MATDIPQSFAALGSDVRSITERKPVQRRTSVAVALTLGAPPLFADTRERAVTLGQREVCWLADCDILHVGLHEGNFRRTDNADLEPEVTKQSNACDTLEQPLRQWASFEPEPFDTETGLGQGLRQILGMADGLSVLHRRRKHRPAFDIVRCRLRRGCSVFFGVLDPQDTSLPPLSRTAPPRRLPVESAPAILRPAHRRPVGRGTSVLRRKL
jgi:hypothetical protein